jgi:ribose transport system substrate-binding protein
MIDVRKLTLGTIATVALATAAVPALAQQGLDEPFQKPFREALAGKTVAYVPVAMNFDLTEGCPMVLMCAP